MAKGTARSPSPYEAIGLAGANEGDVAALGRFLRWSGQELSSVSLFGRQPELIAARVKSLAHHLTELGEFCDGHAQGAAAAVSKRKKRR